MDFNKQSIRKSIPKKKKGSIFQGRMANFKYTHNVTVINLTRIFENTERNIHWIQVISRNIHIY